MLVQCLQPSCSNLVRPPILKATVLKSSSACRAQQAGGADAQPRGDVGTRDASLNGTGANNGAEPVTNFKVAEGSGSPPGAGVPLKTEPKKPKPAPAAREFSNINRFVVPKEVASYFEAEWQRRHAEMQKFPGFREFKLEQTGADTYKVTSRWASIPEWEVWSCSPECRRSHLGNDVYQYVPKKGEGFPEDFIPFKDLDTIVNAKY